MAQRLLVTVRRDYGRTGGRHYGKEAPRPHRNSLLSATGRDELGEFGEKRGSAVQRRYGESVRRRGSTAVSYNRLTELR